MAINQQETVMGVNNSKTPISPINMKIGWCLGHPSEKILVNWDDCSRYMGK